MLENIVECSPDESLRIMTNGGSLVYDKIGDCNLFPIKMYYNPQSIANVLSLGSIGAISGAKITMDSTIEKAINVFLPNGKSFKFQECSDHLYYLNTNNLNNSQVNDYIPSTNFFINSVSNNKKNYSKRQVDKAITARKIHHLIGWPSTDKFKMYVKNNLIKIQT